MIIHHALAKLLDLGAGRSLGGELPQLDFGHPTAGRLHEKLPVAVTASLRLRDRRPSQPPPDTHPSSAAQMMIRCMGPPFLPPGMFSRMRSFTD
jgi:hypothetical protein